MWEDVDCPLSSVFMKDLFDRKARLLSIDHFILLVYMDVESYRFCRSRIRMFLAT